MSMDIIFRVHEQEFISDVVDFKTFLADAIAVRDASFGRVGEFGVRKANANFEHFASFANIDEQRAKDVFDIVDVNKLKSAHVHYNFHSTEPSANAIMPASWHKTLGLLKKEHVKKRNPQYKSVANRLLKYDRVELSLLTVPKFDHLTDCEGVECIKMERDANLLKVTGVVNNVMGVDMPISEEIVVSCSVYYGYSRPLQYDERRLGRLMKVTDKLQLLGSSTLLDVKNAFQCPSDISFAEDMSMCPPHPQYLAKYRFPNSYFFINDTFYIDDSVCEGAFIDLSATVRDWAHDKGYIGEMKVGLMSQTRLADVKARLGMPYLFVHQGQCEHLICFTDLKLWESRDMPHSYYPIKMQEKNFRRVCCIGCKMNTAEWVVIECDRMPFTPAFVCHNCYTEFNFTRGGHKIGEFKAVPYCDRKAMDKSSTLFIQKLLDICNQKPGMRRIKEEEKPDKEAIDRATKEGGKRTPRTPKKKEPVKRKRATKQTVDSQEEVVLPELEASTSAKMSKEEEDTLPTLPKAPAKTPEKIISINDDYDLMEL